MARDKLVAVDDVPFAKRVLLAVITPNAVLRRDGYLIAADRHLQYRASNYLNRVVGDLRGSRIAIAECSGRFTNLGNGREIEIIETFTVRIAAHARSNVGRLDRKRESVIRFFGVHRLKRKRTPCNRPFKRSGNDGRLKVRLVVIKCDARRVFSRILRRIAGNMRRHARRNSRQRHLVHFAVIHPRRRIRRDIPFDACSARLLSGICRLRHDKFTFDLRDIVVARERTRLERVGEGVLARPCNRLRTRHIKYRTFDPDKAVAADRHVRIDKRRSVIRLCRACARECHIALQHLPRRRTLARKVAVRLDRKRVRTRMRRVLASERIGNVHSLVGHIADGNRLNRAVILRILTEDNRKIALRARGDVGRHDLNPAVRHRIRDIEAVIVICEVGGSKPHLRLARIGARDALRTVEHRIRRDIIQFIFR